MIAPSAFSKVLMLNFLLHAERSRKGGNVTKDMQRYLFVSKTHSQRNSGIHILYQMPDFSIPLAAKNLFTTQNETRA